MWGIAMWTMQTYVISSIFSANSEKKLNENAKLGSFLELEKIHSLFKNSFACQSSRGLHEMPKDKQFCSIGYRSISSQQKRDFFGLPGRKEGFENETPTTIALLHFKKSICPSDIVKIRFLGGKFDSQDHKTPRYLKWNKKSQKSELIFSGWNNEANELKFYSKRKKSFAMEFQRRKLKMFISILSLRHNFYRI